MTKNKTWIGPPVGRFIHTGVSLTFQRKDTSVIPAADRLSSLEAWVTTFEAQRQAFEARLGALENK